MKRLPRMVAGWLALVPATLLLYLAGWLPARLRGGWYQPAFRRWTRLFVHALGVDLRLEAHLRGPLPRRFLLIANHPSAFEDIGIPALFDVDSLAKVEVRDWWLVGRISAAAGTLYVRRESRDSRRAAGRAIAARLAAGRNVALYPEGGVKGMRLHHSFRHGVFALSRETGVPVLPVFIHYHAEAAFFWAGEPLPKKLWQIMLAASPRADYHLYPPFDPADYPDEACYAQAVHGRYLEWQRHHLDPVDADQPANS